MAMSLTGPSSPATFGQGSPGDSGDWLSGGLTDAFFTDTGLDDSLELSAEEERIFEALGGNTGFAESLLSERPDEKEVIMAAAQAAGLRKGGIRRTAFSMSDLQALQPPGPPSPPDTSAVRAVTSSVPQRIPKLESVPEGQPSLPTYGNGGLHTVPLSEPLRSSLDEQAEPMHYEQAGHEQGSFELPGSLFTGGTPTEDTLPMSQMGVPQMIRPPDTSGSGTSASRGSGLFQPFSGSTLQSPSGPLAPAASTAPPSQESQMLQGFADALLKQQQRQQQQPRGQGTLAPTAGLPPTSAPPTSALGSQAGPGFPPRVSSMGRELPGVHSPDREHERALRRSQSAIELRSLGGMPRQHSEADLRGYDRVDVELTTPEGHTYHVGRLSVEDRAQKILRYRQKRHERNFSKRIKYQCRKTLADSRPRVRGRFARNNDAGAVLPHETKKAQAERARRRVFSMDEALLPKEECLFPGDLDPDLDYVSSTMPAGDMLASAGGLPDLSLLPDLPSMVPMSSGMPLGLPTAGHGRSTSSSTSSAMAFSALQNQGIHSPADSFQLNDDGVPFREWTSVL